MKTIIIRFFKRIRYKLRTIYQNLKFEYDLRLNIRNRDMRKTLKKSNFSNLMYFKELSIVYNEIKKSGSTNIIIILETMSQIDLKADNQEIIKKAQSVNFTRALRSQRRISLNSIPQLDDLIKLTFVRNPFIRAVSMYKDKIIGKKLIFKGLNDNSHEDNIEYFEWFLEHLIRSKNYLDTHFLPQIDSLFFTLEYFNFIGKIESFDQDFNRFISSFKFESENQVKQILKTQIQTHHITNSKLSFLDYYNEATTQKVLSLYYRDFTSFNYSMNPKEALYE